MMIARSETIRKAIARTEQMIITLEFSSNAEHIDPNRHVTLDSLLKLEHHVLATLQEVYMDNIGRVR